MKILADENIAGLATWFGAVGEIETCAGRSITADRVKDKDLLLVRSVTLVNEALLAGSKIRFVGSCTIGTDHVDQDYLAQQGIGFAHAPGCNAEAVVDYVLSALVTHVKRQGLSLFDLTVGIVGVGQVGSRLLQRLTTLGVRTLGNDPPRTALGESGLVSLEQVLNGADVVCLHTPLTQTGDFPTYHLIQAEQLACMKNGAMLVNAGRGEVVNGDALLHELQSARLYATLDVWPGEPEPDRQLIELTSLATPHIAGYSLAGKLRGTHMVYQAACKFLQREPDKKSLCLKAGTFKLPACFDLLSPEQQLYQLVCSAYPILEDDQAFRLSMLKSGAGSHAFDQLRKNYRVRAEFSQFQLPKEIPPQTAAWAKAVGFNAGK